MPPRASSPKLRSGPALESIYRFGDRLISTGDLDPCYIGIVGLELERRQLSRLLIAYWLFYHLGISAWLSEQGKDFWDAAIVAAENTTASPLGGRWPRGTERRHFRGGQCVAAVRELSKTYPEDLLSQLAVLRTADAVMVKVATWPLCGRWIGFKVADMLERCVRVPIEFPDDTCLMYDEPAAAIAMLAQKDCLTEEKVYNRLRRYFHERMAPPWGDRPCGVQEVETLCCKWKSAQGNHYHIGKDITEVRHGLVGWGDTAKRMLAKMPKEVGEGLFRG